MLKTGQTLNLLVRRRFISISSLTVARYYSACTLRDYQQECIDKCISSISQGKRRIGVSIATGGGKTVIFSNLIEQLRRVSGKHAYKTLILVHRRELALQACNTLKRSFPHLNVQVEMGKYKCNPQVCDVIIASVQSLIRRLPQYDRKMMDLIIIDEAHHAAANSYVEILKHFGADHKESTTPVVGFSATFERADNKALSRVMDEIVFHRGILEMIDDKWLCEGKFTTIDVKVDLSDVAVVGADFNLDRLSGVMNTEEVNRIVLQTYLQKKRDHNLKSTLLFGCDVRHVTSLFELFQGHGINAQIVTAKTRQNERDAIVQDFKEGKIEVLMNCGIFTEGTDLPNIDCILLCRPTKSRSLLVQMIGRGLRLHHGKDYCHIIDFVGVSNVGVVSVPTLAGVNSDGVTLDEATLKDLEQIKLSIIQKQQEYENSIKAEKDREKLLHKQFQQMLENANTFDLTLTTYNDFKSFCEQIDSNHDDVSIDALSDPAKEAKLIKDSVYPWVKFAKDAWAMPLDSGHHLRLYKEKCLDQTSHNYVLKLYTEIPYKCREQSGIRFIPSKVKSSTNLVQVVGSLNALVEELSKRVNNSFVASNVPGSKNFTKFANWRSTSSSPKQRQLIKKKLKDYYLKSEQQLNKGSNIVTIPDIDSYVNKITKGEASNILFALKLAPVYPLNSILKVLRYRKEQLST